MSPDANSPITATVETLRAEVRVLMVGSRQVTMSVYNQLDTVPWLDMTPFGRVRPRDADPRYIDLVGRYWNGELVRSRVADPHLIDQRFTAEYLAQTDGPHAAAAGHKAAEGTSYAEWCAYWSAMWPANLDGRPLDWERADEMWDELVALPLIVLAGLR